ncbi:putative leucine-rich repeat-containing protein DDB_G0290503 isoform X2 [Prorops nasuta]|uniref:putative leucine-rich repeat-containing protein DDB_G0290503 isoform X2 n=1 Tax=Prorops nasuta TaxID=863751 RepID=UPI0034CFA7EE
MEEVKEMIQTDAVQTDTVIPNSFTFSHPNIIPTSDNTTGFSFVLDCSYNEKDLFRFAEPVSISQHNNSNQSVNDQISSEKQYKPKISRDKFKAPFSVSSESIKDKNLLINLKKNPKTQVIKRSIENSITCSEVPEELLTKQAAQSYFEVYGDVRITIRPKKRTITAAYNNNNAATSAYYKCGEYKGSKFKIEWTKNIQKGIIKKKTAQIDKVAEFLKSTDDEIQSELEALTDLEYNLYNDLSTKPAAAEPTIYNAKKSRAPLTKNIGKREKLSTRLDKKVSIVEKLEIDNQASKSLPTASIEELQNIICQAATTSEDKYKILEARDRLMRLKQVRSHSLAMAKATSGTCPDMCPEKERLMRESQRQVAPYEQLVGSEYKINHMIAVKQYSRSSADQEEPMPHELRPVKALKMTMSYLLHEIVNLCESDVTNLGEWYHFLWDRTRGIRKDITQQELCCTDSVELVEQCARFHIVCSERLCAEEPSIFDKKINSENLTKCLQSLKYMYHDLRIKGIKCFNEAEFRSYVILLNLNNGNFMWDLQRLPLFIQKSEEIKFAIQVYSALESNNYNRFFKLVRSTTYLNACILLRYFNQVRERALLVMVKAYNRTNSTAYPLYELIDILGFEDEDEAVYFCEQLGLSVSDDRLYVTLNKRDFQEDRPSAKIEQGRAHNMVESKRLKVKLSIGECIAGCKMPEQTYKNHKPHNSFDFNGYLMQESINANDQNDPNFCQQLDPYDFIEEENLKSVFEQKSSVRKKHQVEDMKTVNHNKVGVICKSRVTTLESKPDNFSSKISMGPFSFKKSQLDRSIYDYNNKIKVDSISSTMNEKSNSANTVKTPLGSKSSEVFVNSEAQNHICSSSNNPFEAKSRYVVPDNSRIANKSMFSSSRKTNVFSKESDYLKVLPISIVKDNVSKQDIPTKASLGGQYPNEISIVDEKEQPKALNRDSAIAEKRKQEEIRQEKQIRNIEKNALHIFKDLENQVIQDYCSIIVKEQLNDLDIYKTLSKKIMEKIIIEIVDEECNQFLNKEIVVLERLRKVSERIQNRLMLKYFNIWKQYIIQEKKQQIKALENTPVWLQSVTLQERAKLLYHPFMKNMREKTKEEEIIPQLLCAQNSCTQTPIEIIVYAGIKDNLKSLDTAYVGNLFWKLIISWPDSENKPIIWQKKRLLSNYVGAKDCTVQPNVKIHSINPKGSQLHISIKCFEGIISKDNLIGSDALLFVADTSEDIQFVNHRLTKTILSRDKLMPIPLVFLVFGCGNLQTYEDETISILEMLLESGYISIYTIIFEQSLTENKTVSLIQDSILWLSANKSSPIPLEMDYLINVCDSCLTEELWLRSTTHKRALIE